MSASVLATAGSSDAVRARPATSADVPAVARTLAAAFFDDPVFSYCYPDVARRGEILPRWFEIVTEATAYLEATSEGNKRLYLRHGFEVVGEIELPGGPSMWPMWRTPKEFERLTRP